MTETSPSARASWPQISDIVPNHDEDRPAPSRDLVGRSFTLKGELEGELTFGDAELARAEQGTATVYEYQCFPVRPGLYFVDAMLSPPNLRSLSLIVDLTSQTVLAVDVEFPEPAAAQRPVLERLARTNSQSAVQVRYRQSSFGGGEALHFERSSDLVGKHLRYTYSSTHQYDHIYHSERFYTWFCRKGPDQGLGDFEECDVFGLGRDLYLVSWREKLLPCVGIIVEDHQAMRSTGKICGADAYTGAIGNARVGARIQLVADTSGR